MSDRSSIGHRSARQYQGKSLTGTNMKFLGLHRSGRTNMRIPALLFVGCWAQNRKRMSFRGPLGPWESPAPGYPSCHIPINIVHFRLSMLSIIMQSRTFRQEIATSPPLAAPRNDMQMGQAGATILHFKRQYADLRCRYGHRKKYFPK